MRRLGLGVLQDAGPTAAAGVKRIAGKAAADKALNAQEKEGAFSPHLLPTLLLLSPKDLAGSPLDGGWGVEFTASKPQHRSPKQSVTGWIGNGLTAGK